MTGETIHSINLAPEYFGEGITIHDDHIYQLTWREHTAFTYTLELDQIDTWTIPNEGWGITQNGTHLIMSDGTNSLSFIDPKTLTIVDTITVTSQGEEITLINELEYIEGYIYANIWQTDQIAIINPTTGKVESWIDLTGLKDQLDTTEGIDVLNGIAYDQKTEKIYVTGKLWPNLFEIKLTPK
jgi:glutamine cyclotransferase